MKTIVTAVLSVAFVVCANGFALAQASSKSDWPDPAGPGLHARLFETHLQPLLEICKDQGPRVACINGFWNVADVSGDGELSVAEITRILRIIAGEVAHQSYVEEHWKFWAGQRPDGPPEPNEGVVVVGVATVGPVMSHSLIANFDYDDNGRLSRAEVLNDIATDIVLSSVEELSPELRSHAQKAAGFLMKLLMQR